MTDNEIIKALECCISDDYACKECPYADTKHMIGDEYEIMPNGKTYDELSCDEWLKLDVLDLINRLQAEKEALIAGQETLQKYIAEQKAEIERLKEDNEIKSQKRAKDVVEVVRCKDCRHCEMIYPIKDFGKEAKPLYYCNVLDSPTKTTEFCSYGERKEADK